MTLSASSSWHSRPALRFLVAGGANTGATALLVVALSVFMPPTIAFTVAFAVGLAAAVVVNGRWVFRSRLSATRVALFASAYCLIYLVGLFAVQMIDSLHGPIFLRGATVCLTAPLSFLAGRCIFPNDERAGDTR